MAKAKKLPSGNWNVLVYAGTDSNGKRKYESFTAESKKEAEFLAAEFALTRKNRKGGNITVQEAMLRYAESKRNVLSPATYREYLGCARRDLKLLHNVPLRELTQEKIQQAINVEAQSHSPKTVKNMHGILSATLAMFLPDFKLNTTLPQKRKAQVYIPTDEDIKTLLKIVEGTPIEVPILLAATGSLRRSEIAALTPEDIQDGGVVVSKAMVLDSEHRWVVKQPKTQAGYRFCPLPPNVVKKARAGVPTISPSQISNQFARALNASDLPKFSFHKLRHYYASALHAMGVPDKYIMQNGGWECESVLQGVYQHTLADQQEDINEQVKKRFSGF